MIKIIRKSNVKYYDKLTCLKFKKSLISNTTVANLSYKSLLNSTFSSPLFLKFLLSNFLLSIIRKLTLRCLKTKKPTILPANRLPLPPATHLLPASQLLPANRLTPASRLLPENRLLPASWLLHLCQLLVVLLQNPQKLMP